MSCGAVGMSCGESSSEQDVVSLVETAENEKKNAQKKLDIINTKVQRLPEVIERIKKSTENNNEQPKTQE